MFACECTLEFHGQPFARDHCSPSRCPFHAANAHVHVSHRQPFVRAHCSTSRWPPSAAPEHVVAFHWQPFARAHCSTLRCPPSAALSHVSASHGQPFACSHFITSSCPVFAASCRRFSDNSRRPCRCKCLSVLKYPSPAATLPVISSTTCPVAATASRIARLTARSTARSVGSLILPRT